MRGLDTVLSINVVGYFTVLFVGSPGRQGVRIIIWAVVRPCMAMAWMVVIAIFFLLCELLKVAEYEAARDEA